MHLALGIGFSNDPVPEPFTTEYRPVNGSAVCVLCRVLRHERRIASVIACCEKEYAGAITARCEKDSSDATALIRVRVPRTEPDFDHWRR